jgi:hypothetical protein
MEYRISNVELEMLIADAKINKFRSLMMQQKSLENFQVCDDKRCGNQQPIKAVKEASVAWQAGS